LAGAPAAPKEDRPRGRDLRRLAEGARRGEEVFLGQLLQRGGRHIGETWSAGESKSMHVERLLEERSRKACVAESLAPAGGAERRAQSSLGALGE
jgi:hypothetical protein